MRQVPTNPEYLLIGGGRLASHLRYYFEALGASITTWDRQTGSEADLNPLISSHSHCLLAISDDSIPSFFQEHSGLRTQFVHFSGSLVLQGVLGFHPLMTFGGQVYDLDQYKSIHFVGNASEQEFRETLPFLKNSYFHLSPEKMALYHGLCVLGGNGTTLLWDLIENEFSKIGLPKEALHPYLNQVTANIESDEPDRKTGPWHRKDFLTIDRNRRALENTSLEPLYTELQKMAMPQEKR